MAIHNRHKKKNEWKSRTQFTYKYSHVFPSNIHLSNMFAPLLFSSVKPSSLTLLLLFYIDKLKNSGSTICATAFMYAIITTTKPKNLLLLHNWIKAGCSHIYENIFSMKCSTFWACWFLFSQFIKWYNANDIFQNIEIGFHAN